MFKKYHAAAAAFDSSLDCHKIVCMQHLNLNVEQNWFKQVRRPCSQVVANFKQV